MSDNVDLLKERLPLEANTVFIDLPTSIPQNITTKIKTTQHYSTNVI